MHSGTAFPSERGVEPRASRRGAPPPRPRRAQGEGQARQAPRRAGLPSAALPPPKSFSLSLSLSTCSLNKCTGQWPPPSVMSWRLDSELPSSRARASPLSKTSRYVIESFLPPPPPPPPPPPLLSLLFWSKDLDTKAVSSSMAARGGGGGPAGVRGGAAGLAGSRAGGPHASPRGEDGPCEGRSLPPLFMPFNLRSPYLYAATSAQPPAPAVCSNYGSLLGGGGGGGRTQRRAVSPTSSPAIGFLFISSLLGVCAPWCGEVTTGFFGEGRRGRGRAGARARAQTPAPPKQVSAWPRPRLAETKESRGGVSGRRGGVPAGRPGLGSSAAPFARNLSGREEPRARRRGHSGDAPSPTSIGCELETRRADAGPDPPALRAA